MIAFKSFDNLVYGMLCNGGLSINLKWANYLDKYWKIPCSPAMYIL